ncbi:hypothetical protein R1sor_022932 [Riccia sorocarpa]|uniref:Myb-like domain-containing protein n=1 Tax=Riccia sorocarpa TaxID=122646 RepID=A0ABD3GQ62_9MARC
MSHPNPLSNSADVCFSEPNPNVGIESLHGTNYPSSAPVLPRPSEDFYESSRDRWTDEHVHELITLRAEMDVEFEDQAGKQGVNNWQRLHRRLSVAVRGFTKSWESCKKKWQAEYKKYRTDKRHLNISGNSRHITCKYFDVIDDAWKNRANVKKVKHGDAHLSENPAPMESPADTINTTVSPLQGAALDTPPTSGVVSVSPTLITRQDRKDAKRSTPDRLCGLISDIAMHSASLAQTSESFLKSFDSHMANLIAKL